MIFELLLYIFLVTALYFLYVYKRNHYYFKKRSIKYSPGVPIFGNVYGSSLGFQHFIDDLERVYRKFPDEKYVGFIEGNKRVIMIRDLDLARDVLVKNFNHFVNRKVFFPDSLDPLLGNSLLSIKGNNWREKRSKLSPSFTSSKIKNMMPLMIEVANNVIYYIKANQSNPIDVLDLLRRYANDVIASAVFGIQIDSIHDRNNDFFKTCQDTIHFGFVKIFCIFLISQWPSSVNLIKVFIQLWLNADHVSKRNRNITEYRLLVTKQYKKAKHLIDDFVSALSVNLSHVLQKLGISVTKPENVDFFRAVVTKTIENREKNNIVRPDFIQLLLKASKDWTTDEIVGQAYLAYIAGFDTVSNTLSMCIHLLVLNPEVQEKLYQEIKKNEEINGLTYDCIADLKYMDCVLSEAERMWSAAVVLDRECTIPYDLPPPKEGAPPYRIQPGDLIYFPSNSVHMDPNYFEDPKKFNPERFSDENKHNIKPFSFVPFGVGPRNCLGMRFANLQMKVILYQILLNFRIEKCDKTVEEIFLKSSIFSVKAKGGTWARFVDRRSINV